MDMNEQLIQTMSVRSKRTFDQLQAQFPLRDTEKRKKITTGATLFGSATDEGQIEEPSIDEHSSSFEAQAAAQRRTTIRTIGTITPIEDFKALLQQDRAAVISIFQQMAKLIMEFVHHSHGDTMFDKAIQCLLAYREAAASTLEPKAFNDFLISVKKQSSNPDGPNDFWQRILHGKSAS
jgi:hypothetical protein